MLTLRADTAPSAGLGHVTRCAALAAAWDRRGTDTDWTVIDDYGATPEQQRAARERGRVLVIDDHASLGRYDADLVLDQNLGATGYEGAERVLLGPRFVLLREQFRSVRPRKVRSGAVLSGGGAPSEETQALLADVGAAVGGTRPNRVTVLAGITDVAGTLAGARVMIGAAGSTAYECCAVGTPMILFAVAANQEPLGERLAAAGAAIYLGRVEKIEVADVLAALVEADLASMAAAAARVVDADGADRVAVQMRAFDLDLRPAASEDCRRVWEWSNDPTVRATSFRSDPVAWEDHVRWFDRQLRDPERYHFIASAAGRPIGQIRFECAAGRALLGFSIDEAHRGAGWGAPLVVAGVRALRERRPVIEVEARVKHDNPVSARCFDLAAFRETGSR